jgi:hypothetical protein
MFHFTKYCRLGCDSVSSDCAQIIHRQCTVSCLPLESCCSTQSLSFERAWAWKFLADFFRADSCEGFRELDGCARSNVSSVEARRVDISFVTVTLICRSKFCRPTSWTLLSALHLEGLDRRVGMVIYASLSPAPYPTCCRPVGWHCTSLHKTQLQ